MNHPQNTKFEGYVYLDHYYPPIIWNIVRGGFSSADILSKNKKMFPVSISIASMLQNSAVNRLNSELHLDHIRQQIAPLSVSRLKGLFVFDDIDSVAQIWEANKWGGHFQAEYLSDVGVYAENSTRLDSNWIAQIISDDGSLKSDWVTAAKNYWIGAPCSDKKPIWERIVSGTFTIWSMHSKEAALKEIKAIWPASMGLLAHSMNCFKANSLDGQCFPGVVFDSTTNTIKIEYYLRMLDSLKKDFIENLYKHEDKDNKSFVDQKLMYSPNLDGFSTEININNKVLFNDTINILSTIFNKD